MLLYILFEHQSLNYVRMPLRMGRYMDRIWDDFDREHPNGPLPPKGRSSHSLNSGFIKERPRAANRAASRASSRAAWRC